MPAGKTRLRTHAGPLAATLLGTALLGAVLLRPASLLRTPARLGRAAWLGTAMLLRAAALRALPLGRGCRARAAVAGLEAFDHAALDLAGHEPLNGGHQRTVFVADEGDGFALGAGTAGAADAVHIVLGHMRQVEVDHVGQGLDVEAARGDIGRHQHAQLVALEKPERAGARVLALVAVDRVGLDAALLELAGEAGCARRVVVA